MSLILPDFPNSIFDPFLITSPMTTYYNCIAWAFGDSSKWYWPDPDDIAFWPKNIPRTIELNSFIELYRLIGYEVCDNSNLEIGLEKIAIYADEMDSPTHAARQLINGFWTSKLGNHHDVQHTLFSLNGSVYGNAKIYMSRIITLQSHHLQTK